MSGGKAKRRPARKPAEDRGPTGAIAAPQIADEPMTEETRQRKALMHSVLKSIPIDLWARDLQGRCFLQSSFSEQLWGKLGTLGHEGLDPQTVAQWQANNERVLRGEVVRGEVSLVTRQGERRDFYNIVAPITDGQTVRGCFGVNIDVTERKNAEAAAQEKQRLLQQSLEVYERHQQLAAYEIHDGVAQPLAGALMNLEAALLLLDAQRIDAARGGLAKTRQLLQDTMDQARRLMNGLRPPILDELGILPAIDHLVFEHQSAGIMAVQYTQSVSFARLAPPLETAVFRIIQEGLANAERHSRSDRARLALVEEGDRVRVEVEDWGVGFDPARVDPGRFGLKGIRERAHLFGGSATIHSAPGRGTRITVEIPLVEAVPKPAWDAT